MELEFYVIHSSPLTFRKTNIEKLIDVIKESDIKVSHKYINKFEPNEVDKPSLSSIVSLKPPEELDESSIYKQVAQNINIRQISNLLKHANALEQIANSNENSNKYHIVIEDDVVYPEDLVTQIQKIFSNINHDYDILFIGLPATKEYDSQPLSRNVFDDFKIIPCIDSYIIKPKVAKKICEILKPVFYPTNIQLSYCIQKLNLNAKYTIPNIFADGSKVGVYTSLLTSNNKLFLNNHYNELLNIVKQDTLTDEMYENAKTIIEQCQGIKEHPDMGYLIAVLEMKRGDITKAYEIMKNIYDIYLNNGCILNHESEFLRLYIDIHKHIENV
jgi:hypothetical protein